MAVHTDLQVDSVPFSYTPRITKYEQVVETGVSYQPLTKGTVCLPSVFILNSLSLDTACVRSFPPGSSLEPLQNLKIPELQALTCIPVDIRVEFRRYRCELNST